MEWEVTPPPQAEIYMLPPQGIFQVPRSKLMAGLGWFQTSYHDCLRHCHRVYVAFDIEISKVLWNKFTDSCKLADM